MYRDDTCAVCGASLPPDHFYCREHAEEVDDRLHEIGRLVPRVARDLGRLAELVGQIAPETWDYLSEREEGDPSWPPVPAVELRAEADEVDVDVDHEPGMVRACVTVPLAQLLSAVSLALDTPELERAVAACQAAEGANATH